MRGLTGLDPWPWWLVGVRCPYQSSAYQSLHDLRCFLDIFPYCVDSSCSGFGMSAQTSLGRSIPITVRLTTMSFQYVLFLQGSFPSCVSCLVLSALGDTVGATNFQSHDIKESGNPHCQVVWMTSTFSMTLVEYLQQPQQAHPGSCSFRLRSTFHGLFLSHPAAEAHGVIG